MSSGKGENIKTYKQEIANKCAKFTIEELLSILRVGAQYICRKPDDVHSIAVSTINDFIKWHGKYVSFI